MANSFKKQEKTKKKKRSAFSKIAAALLNGEFLTRQGLIKFLPFILFMTGLFIVYIAVGYFFENTLRDHVRTKRQLEELTSEYNTIQSKLENKKQQSAVIDEIDELGLESATSQPNIIEVKPGYFEE